MDTGDVVAIHQLLALYGHVADAAIEGTADRLDEIFTEGAVFDGSAGAGTLHHGLAEIRALFRRVDPPHPPAHHMSNPYVWEEQGQVRALSKWMGIDRATGGSRSGAYRDLVVRTPQGWRIAERVVVYRWWDGPPEPPSG